MMERKRMDMMVRVQADEAKQLVAQDRWVARWSRRRETLPSISISEPLSLYHHIATWLI